MFIKVNYINLLIKKDFQFKATYLSTLYNIYNI